MKTTSLLASLALLATVLAVIPSAQAESQAIQPCPTYTGGCCATFAPCCSILTCPTPILRCPTESVSTYPLLQYPGPQVTVESNSNCTADACLDSLTCSASQCSTDATCCTVTASSHTCVCDDDPVETTMAAVALPIPHVSETINRDCSVTVTETYDCPNGFWDTTSYLNEGPLHIVADGCAPMCACMPIEIAKAE